MLDRAVKVIAHQCKKKKKKNDAKRKANVNGPTCYGNPFDCEIESRRKVYYYAM